MAKAINGAIYKVFNGTDWDTYYFKTSLEAVIDVSSSKNLVALLGEKLSLASIDSSQFTTSNTDGTPTLQIKKLPTSLTIEVTDGTSVQDSVIFNGEENKTIAFDSTTFSMAAGGKLSINTASSTSNGIITKETYNMITSVYSYFEENDTNDVIDKIQEIIAVFDSYKEGLNLATELRNKVGFDNLNTSTYFTKDKDNNVSVKYSDKSGKVSNSLSIAIYNVSGDDVEESWTFDGSASKIVQFDSSVFKSTEGVITLKNLKHVFAQPTAPSEPVEGMVWIQTAS